MLSIAWHLCLNGVRECGGKVATECLQLNDFAGFFPNKTEHAQGNISGLSVLALF